MTAPRLKPLDARGRRVRVGDYVRVTGVPDLSSMPKDCRSETEPVFRHLRGQRKRISGFNEYGLAEIIFSIRKGYLRGWHSVAIEPHLLLLQV